MQPEHALHARVKLTHHLLSQGSSLFCKVRDGSLEIESRETTKKLDLHGTNVKFEETKLDNKNVQLTVTFDSDMKLPDDFNFRTVRFICKDSKRVIKTIVRVVRVFSP